MGLIEHYTRSALRYYNAEDAIAILSLDTEDCTLPDLGSARPETLALVPLPAWGQDLEADGGILVPSALAGAFDGESWRKVCWPAVIAWYLHGSAERAFERQSGPIHSFAMRLCGWDSRLWRRAWVNRISLFLRRWAARERGSTEQRLFGALPPTQILVTHDVDAIEKHLSLRLKQGAFHMFNAARLLVSGRVGGARDLLGKGLRFLFGRGDYWCFPLIRALEARAGIVSHFNVYAGSASLRPGLRRWLFDPVYSPSIPKLRETLKMLAAEGCVIGLHQSYGSWNDPVSMRRERLRLENSIGQPVASCRQHWLRFAWDQTWRAQDRAGFRSDTTLGFNDCSGFRTGAAVPVQPWDESAGRPLQLVSLPMVLMDSHLYDYGLVEESSLASEMSRWVNEVTAVRGRASVIWHQRVLSDDYGWRDGFVELLAQVRRANDGSK